MSTTSKQMKEIMLRIKSRRENLGLSFQQLADLTHMSKSTLQRYETGGIKNIPLDKLEVLAQALQTTPTALLGIDDDYAQTLEVLQTIIDPQNASQQVVEQLEYEKELSASNKKSKALRSVPEIENLIPLPKTKKVPLVGTIACGTPITAVENVEDYIDMSEDVRADFALRCKGDSMINARIFDGDIVYIRQQPDVENGEIAAVYIDGEATLKRVFKHRDSLELRAENPTFPTLYYEGEELNSIRILGKAVAFLSGVR